MSGLTAIRGQPRAVLQLRRAISSGKLAGAYLFTGPPGVGKATTALALAAALNCERADGDACGTCSACTRIASGNHPDVLRLAPEGAARMIAIDPIRELAARMGYPPHEGRARVVVLDDAERLGIAAANAFLKTLEEPPARTFFVLVSAAPDALLVTIRSRCQRIRFAPLPRDEVAAIVEAGGASPANARLAAALAGGSAARAAELADGEALAARQLRVAALLIAATSGTLGGAVPAATRAVAAADDLGATLELFAHRLRDAAALAAGVPTPDRDAGMAASGDEPDLAARLAERGPRALARGARATLAARRALTAMANPQLTLERLLVELRAEQP